ncbi:uncharacterized protein C8A04DRAFT_28115 [Dichotomopilus funicola]|uniref:2EXR domain-containing protein n=1 Tax=Dichotomopilus funicola TaxID=1934379 RepID=A0AAN6V3H8_9PEZI|nr:hypothetical protein C8A04DRAFT_28115 [Dichotomopilus funicola]
MATSSFHLFPALPPELRFQIWESAFSIPAVWAGILFRPTREDEISLKARAFTAMAFGKAHWVNLSHTVVSFWNPLLIDYVLANLDADTISRFKHAAITWHIHQIGPLAEACQRLATVCPDLNTIIIQWWGLKALPDGPNRKDAVENRPPPYPLNPETAAHFAEISVYTGHELDCPEIDMPYLRSQLLQYFGAYPPKLHLVTTKLSRRLP